MELLGLLHPLVPYWQLFVENAPNLVGFAMPIAVQAINRDVPDEDERLLMSFLACFIVAVALHWQQVSTGIDPQHLASWVGIVFTESYLTYKYYFKGSPVQAKVNQLVRAKSTQVDLPVGDGGEAAVSQ